jgi:DNA repair protein RecN (Recombination protein N)
MGGWLIDLHGPHDHQSLLQPRLQLSLVDAYGGLEPQRAWALAGHAPSR